jgi:hypothetical protein
MKPVSIGTPARTLPPETSGVIRVGLRIQRAQLI